jgi:hypothetical protein
MLSETGIQTRPGDILLLRTGFTRDYSLLSTSARQAMATAPPTFLGVQSHIDVLQWIWEAGFVAVAGDAPSFEMSPLVGAHNAPGGIWKGESWEDEMQGGGLLHQWLLGGWGVMIGEMWDLEGLCERAVELGRHTCFVSSVPLKVSSDIPTYTTSIMNRCRNYNILMWMSRYRVVLPVRRMLLLFFRVRYRADRVSSILSA